MLYFKIHMTSNIYVFIAKLSCKKTNIEDDINLSSPPLRSYQVFATTKALKSSPMGPRDCWQPHCRLRWGQLSLQQLSQLASSQLSNPQLLNGFFFFFPAPFFPPTFPSQASVQKVGCRLLYLLPTLHLLQSPCHVLAAPTPLVVHLLQNAGC